MKKVTIDLALKAIENKFFGLADILNVDNESFLDIILKDVRTSNYYEVFSNSDYTNLKIRQIHF